MPTPRSSSPVLLSLRIIAGAVMSAVVVIGIVAYILAPPVTYPPVWVPAGLGGYAVLILGICELVGYSAPAIAPGTEPAEATDRSVNLYRAKLIIRLALCESVALVALAAMFVVLPSTAWTYYVGAVLALGLLAVEVWPGARSIRRTQQSLERSGARSYLRETLLGVPPDDAVSPIREG